MILKFLKWLVRIFLHIFYPFKIEGEENIPETGGIMLCSNHISFLDPVLYVAVCKRQINFMAKSDLFDFKPFGALLRYSGAFPVKRGKGDKGAINEAVNLVKSGEVMGIFVEGMRTANPDYSPQRAKSGAAIIAASTGADVIPAAVIYKSGRPKPFRRCVIRIGKPIPADEIKIEDMNKTQIRNVTERIITEITELWKAGI